MVAVEQTFQREQVADDRRLSRRDEWAIAFFGTWMVTGLFLDGWAHEASKPESFFSPWHGVLYSGFAAAMVFFAIDAYRMRARGEVVRMERLSVAGLAMFAAGGALDMAWHEIFGIEVGIDALLSPTHLMLMCGGLLLATAPLRAAWAEPDDDARTSSLRSFLPTVVSLTLAIALASFFSMYVSAFDDFVLSGDVRGEGAVVQMITSLFVTVVLFVVPTLLVLRRWSPPAGTFTLLFGVVAIAMVGLDGFERWPLAVPAVAAGLTADVLTRRLRGIRRIRAVAVAVPLVFTAAWFEIFAHAFGLGVAPEAWTGTIVLACLGSLALSYLAFPPALPATARSRAAIS